MYGNNTSRKVSTFYLLVAVFFSAIFSSTPARTSQLPEDVNLYLPIIFKGTDLPTIPFLYDIDNADGDGSYSVHWSTSTLATSYTLEEDIQENFPNPVVMYSGSNTTKEITGRVLGVYFYRVKSENQTGYSDWSEMRSATVTQQAPLICETHNFGTPGVSFPILASGSTDHFVAVNTMLVETVEVKSVLKALYPVNIYVAVGINGTQVANKTHYVFSNAYTPYYINKSVANELHASDDIYYYISKNAGTTEAWISWGNYVKFCGR
jgi:hypothetical protein